jgi:hypothetical protein
LLRSPHPRLPELPVIQKHAPVALLQVFPKLLHVWGPEQDTHFPALQRPLLQTLPQAPQLLPSVWRSLQVSGVVPHSFWLALQGQTVAVAVAVVVTVTEGVIVWVAAGTVVKTVSVSVVAVVKTIASVTEEVSVTVVTVVAVAVADVRSKQLQAVEIVSQAKPV